MKLAFVGAVEGSRVVLDALICAGLPPSLVVTLPPQARDRHSDYCDLQPSAAAAGSAIHFTTSINAPETLEALAGFAPDLTMVIGWSQICKAKFRAIARIGNIGFHPAALPRFRSRAVIPWTILQGEAESGSTMFWLDEGTDSGPIRLQQRFPIAPDETARSLYDGNTGNLAIMLPQAVRQVEAGDPPCVIQDHAQASYCAKRTPDDGLIDWRQPAADILWLIRAVGDPYPGAFSYNGGEKLIIDRATPVTNSHQFIGLTGQVQSQTARGFTVRFGDGNLIEVEAWRSLQMTKKSSSHRAASWPRRLAWSWRAACRCLLISTQTVRTSLRRQLHHSSPRVPGR